MSVLLMTAIISINVVDFVDPSWDNSFQPMYPLITDIAVWDFDGDGNVEIAFTTYSLNESMDSDGHVYVLEYNGMLLQTEFVSVESNSYQACKWFDYDEDGDSDLLVAASVTIANDGYVGVFINNNGILSEYMAIIANETQWDPLDLAISDFNNDNVIDVLVVCADRYPQILQGYYNTSGAYQIDPNPVTLPITFPLQNNCPTSFFRASIADVNDDNTADILVASPNYVGELRSIGNSYSLSSIGGKTVDSWISCAYGPPLDSAPSAFTTLVGLAWGDGIGQVYENGATSLSGYLLENPGPNEFVSDISTTFASENENEQYYLSIAECGLLGTASTETRSRHCRVNSWNYYSAGHYGVYSSEYFADPLELPLKPEAFCTEWTSIDSAIQYEITFTFTIDNPNQRLFLISDIPGVGFEENIRTKLGIIKSEIHRDHQLMNANVQYIENGLVYLRTPPQAGDELAVTFLTTNKPSPVYGRRGLLEIYEVF